MDPPVSDEPRTVRQVRACLQAIAPDPRPFDVRLWDGTRLRGAAEPEFTIVLRHPGALGRMLTPPFEDRLATAFVAGDFDVEGDIVAALRVFDELARRRRSPVEVAAIVGAAIALPRAAMPGASAPLRPRLDGRRHSRERDRAAIRHHYDVGNEFFALWLDERSQYSCAYFERPSMSLDLAQEAKLELVCRKLRLREGERLLDIGCGWGGLAIHAARRHGARVVGVTLSHAQAEHAARAVERAGLSDRVEIREQDYRDVADGPFDKVASIGMFEHVGRSQLARYFRNVKRLLAPGGLFLNHGIASRPAPRRSPVEVAVRRAVLGAGAFIPRYVFPDGELIPVSEVNLVAEREGLEVRDVENLREHYALTLRRWVERLEARRKDAIALTSDATYRTWRLYMAGSANAFESGRVGVHQTLLAAPTAEGRVRIPVTRADVYREELTARSAARAPAALAA